jgi:hypothetical protein
MTVKFRKHDGYGKSWFVGIRLSCHDSMGLTLFVEFGKYSLFIG